MTTFQKFKRALIDMKNAGELDKILEAARDSAEDKAKVEHDIMIIEQLAEFGEDKVSAIPVIMELQSIAIFKDALCFMLKLDDKEEA